MRELAATGFMHNRVRMIAASFLVKDLDCTMAGEPHRQGCAGLERRHEAGEPLEAIASVASFFVSRVDNEVDRRLDAIGTPDPLIVGSPSQVIRKDVHLDAWPNE